MLVEGSALRATELRSWDDLHIHPESFRIHSPAWDHQKLFTAGRALEAELGLRPLRSRAREGHELPQRAADFEERDLVRQFGERYLAYRKSVPKVLPPLWTSPSPVMRAGAPAKPSTPSTGA
ncbi:MAG: hypothetical protein WAU39_11440 [Polyangiales bacterium]